MAPGNQTNNPPLGIHPKVGDKHTSGFVLASWNPTGSNQNKCDWFNRFCDKQNVTLANIQEHFRIGHSASKYFSKEFPKSKQI